MQRTARITLLILVAGCGGKKDEAKAPPPPTATPDAAAVTATGAPPPAPLTPARLAPVIQAIGGEGLVPTALTVELATAIIDQDAVGRVSSRSVLKLVPETPGTLTHSGVSTLTFVPARPFAFGTSYRATLARVETRDGTVEPAPGGNETWSAEFVTPAFAFTGWAPTGIDLDKKKVVLALTFSGPVLAASAKPFLAVTLDGKPVGKLTIDRTAEPHVLQLSLTDPRLALGGALRLAVKKNLPAADGTTAAAATADYIVSNDLAIDLKAALLKESPQGYYIEVICDDGAAETGHRSYYDDEDANFYGLSQRCQLRDDAAARITFKPAVKNVYLTPGKAGFRIFGDFARGNLSMTIPAGVTSVDGGVLMGKVARSFSVPARKAQVAFASTGRYLPRSAWNQLGVRHLNVENANLIVRQVPPENLVFWLSDDRQEAADERTSNLILKQTLPLRGQPDSLSTTWLDVASLLPATTRGVLELKLAAVGADATSRLLLTDLSLVAKKSAPAKELWNQEVHVWALAIDSTAPVDGVDVSLVRKSGKTVARCTTSGGGGCVLRSAPGDADEAEPFAIIARKGDDLTYLRWRDLRTEAAEANVSGEPYVLEAPYRAAVWPDRGVYRPGDTAHVVAVVRDRKDVAPAEPLPVEIKLVDPRAKTVKRVMAKTNPAGLVTLDHAFAAFADTGGYRVELAVADKTIGQVALQVEEFVPERMKVTIEPARADLGAGDEASFAVSARYLFGGSAEGSEATLTCRLGPERFEPAQNGDYTYGVEPRGKPIAVGEEKATLDAKGAATIACPAIEGGVTQTGRLTGHVAVLEAGSGRATTRAGSAVVHPERHYLGLKTGTTRAQSGTPFTVEGLVVDWKGAPITTVKEVAVEILHLEAEYDYAYDDDDGSSYRRLVHAVPEGKQKAPVENGKFRLDVTPVDAGVGVMVRVTAGKAISELVVDGEYPYYADEESDGERPAEDATPRPSRATQLALVTPREVAVGKPLEVKLSAPYKGRILFAVETDRLVASEWKDVAGGEVRWSWTPTAFAPNVYVSAFLIKDPHLESQQAFLPDRAFGVASVKIAPTEQLQTVELEAPKQVRSSSKLTVKLAATPADGPIWATVAVVDEGILSLTRFETPDPLARLQSKRALAVETYETIGWTQLHAPAGPSSRTGGGDEDGDGSEISLAESRVQPVKPVALFSGPVQLDAAGKATVSFDLPAYRGELRVMAFTVSARRVGRAEASVTVADPLVAQVTFPRFSTHGDEMQIPVFLTNLSGGPLDVTVAMSGEPLPVPGLDAPAATAVPPLSFLGKQQGSVRLEDGKSQTVVFQVKANQQVGAAKLKVVATGKGARPVEARDEVDVPFLPSGPRERIVQRLELAAGSTDLAPALRGWVPTSERSTFWVTSNPYGESFDHLKYLIRYPYGCVEQTTSSTRPLLAIGHLVEQVDPATSAARLEDMVMSGINRVLSMQTPSGGLGYWPGDDHPSDWGTAYATHMLLDARKAGYAVPEDRLAEILGYIENRVTQLEGAQGSDPRTYYRYDEQAEIYMHYVLAVAGKGRKARMSRLLTSMSGMSNGQRAESAYMLKAALWLAGDRRHEDELKRPDVSQITDDRSNGWSFYSDRRRRGFMLSTFVDLFGKSPEGEELAQRVAASLLGRPSGYYTTQELVWGVTGLGKWVEGGAADFEPGRLLAAGKPVEARPVRGKSNDRTWALVRASELSSLTLELPKKGEGKLYLVISSDGVREKPEEKFGGNGLTVERRYRNVAGAEVDLAAGNVKLGEVLYVEVEIGNTTGEAVQNLALVDRLPAGLEIENPRLGREGLGEWIAEDDLWSMDYLDLRDDRVQVFGTLPPRTSKKVIYTVRAVTSGKFVAPPVEAEAMYDPSLWARAKGGTVVIAGPWEGLLI